MDRERFADCNEREAVRYAAAVYQQISGGHSPSPQYLQSKADLILSTGFVDLALHASQQEWHVAELQDASRLLLYLYITETAGPR